MTDTDTAYERDSCAQTADIAYFAFGMNMVDHLMPYGTRDPQQAWLDGYALRYSTFADVVPQQGSSVAGVLWHITADGLRSLDYREGYPTLYDRETLTVRLADGTTVPAIVYVRSDQPTYHGAASLSDAYVDLMHQGREAVGHTTSDLPLTREQRDRMADHQQARRDLWDTYPDGREAA